MPVPTPELGLLKGVDADDTADYLVTSLATSLTTVDALFNNVSGHTHTGSHQGGPIGVPPASSIPGSALVDNTVTSAKIVDGTIQTGDLANGAATSSVIAGGFLNPTTTSTSPVAVPGLTTPSLTCVGGRTVLVHVVTTVQPTAITQNCNLFLFRDGASVGCMQVGSTAAANQILAFCYTYYDSVTPGAHTWGLGWSTSAGTLQMIGAAFSSVQATELRA